jgi:ATP-dependent helicase HrpB
LDRPDSLDALGLLLALAYPDRIAQRQRGNDTRYLMANGRGALFANPDPLGSEDYLVIAALDGGTQWARIDLAAPVQLRDLETLYADQIQVVTEVSWNDTARAVRATRQRRLSALVLSEQGLSKPDPTMISLALLEGIRRAGLARLAWTPELRQWLDEMLEDKLDFTQEFERSILQAERDMAEGKSR